MILADQLSAAYHVDPPSAAYDASEIKIQTVFRSRCRVLCPRVHVVAIPNAAKRSLWSANRAKLEGMAPGFPDVQAIFPGGKIVFVEFKTRLGKISEEQNEWLERLTRYGFPAGVFRHPDTALEFLRSHGAPFIDRAGL